jgi:hypothetical protein
MGAERVAPLMVTYYGSGSPTKDGNRVREVIGIAISTAAEAKEEVFDRRKWGSLELSWSLSCCRVALVYGGDACSEEDFLDFKFVRVSRESST